MVDGVTLSRPTKTDDKALATKIARKWDHEAVQQIKVDSERPVLLHDAIEDFLADRMHNKGYISAAGYMKKWKSALPNVYIKTLHKHQVQKVVADQIMLGLAHNTVSVFVDGIQKAQMLILRLLLKEQPSLTSKRQQYAEQLGKR